MQVRISSYQYLINYTLLLSIFDSISNKTHWLRQLAILMFDAVQTYMFISHRNIIVNRD